MKESIKKPLGQIIGAESYFGHSARGYGTIRGTLGCHATVIRKGPRTDLHNFGIFIGSGDGKKKGSWIQGFQYSSGLAIYRGSKKL